jgi:hypothetical protein
VYVPLDPHHLLSVRQLRPLDLSNAHRLTPFDTQIRYKESQNPSTLVFGFRSSVATTSDGRLPPPPPPRHRRSHPGRSERYRSGLSHRQTARGPWLSSGQTSPIARSRDSLSLHQGQRDLHLAAYPAGAGSPNQGNILLLSHPLLRILTTL